VLPSDKYIASLLGLTDEQYEYWQDYVRDQAKKGPEPAVIAGEPATTLAIVSLVLTVVGTGFQIIGALLQQRPGRPAELKSRNRNGNNQVEQTSFAPRAGFDAVQDVAAIGAPIPVVYAKRESIGGVAYGGVRVNLSLLWSQIWSLGSSQMLRAVFMISEGKIVSIDPAGFAIGDNSLGVYDLLSNSGNEIGSRITIYHRPDGGRLTSADRISGRLANSDIGNAQNNGGADVFYLQSINNVWSPDFSAAIKPSASTTFGVYSPIGNNLGFKLNPVVRPAVTARLRPKGKKGDATVVCDLDKVVRAQRAKYSAYFSSRSGITAGSSGPISYNIGDTITYKLLRSSDFNTEFSGLDPSSDSWTVAAEPDEALSFFYPDGFLVDGTPNFPEKVAIAASPYLSALSFGAITVNTTNRTVSSVVTVDLTTIAGIASNYPIGEKIYDYNLFALNTEEDIRVENELGLVVNTRRVTKYEATSGDGTFSREYSVTQTKNDDGLVTNVGLNSSGTKVVSITTVIGSTDFLQRNYDLQLPEGSGPVQVLSSPPRLRANIVFTYKKSDAYGEKADDAASSITGRQRSWDDAIVIGDLYKIGSALAVCTNRSPSDEIFRSDSELQSAGSGQSITASFRVVRAGQAATVTESSLEEPGTVSVSRQTATSGPHIMRVALANLTTTRECRIVEIGFRSRLGISISGLLRFRSTLSFADTDGRACLNKEGDLIKRGNTVKVDQYQSGVVTTAEERYSFFRISYRQYSESSFTNLSQCFGAVGLTQQSVFNYIRFEMPSLARWEFRIEPLTGWEIRNSIASGDLCVLDAKLSSLSTVTTTAGGRTVKATFNGRIVSRSVSVFRLRQTQRDPGMGLPYADTNSNYADAWGKLAEFFVYDEIDTSASGGPEHEIIYVNEIVQNFPTPNYGGIALVGINVRSAFEWAQFRQLSAYINQGAEIRRLLNSLSPGASHLFPDIALDRFTNPKYGPGRIDDEMIDILSFQSAAQWCQDRKYFFDGPVMLATDSPRQWAADVASTMLLDFREVNGKYSLSPSITFSPVEHKALFTAAVIEEGSFKFETIPVDDLEPVRVSVKWREERSSSSPTSPGLFPVEREVLVQEATPFGSDTNQIESVDVSEYVTNENHAIDIAKIRIRSKRLRDHSIQFTTTYDAIESVCRELSPGDYIKVAMQATAYNQYNNGAVLESGKIVSTTELVPGTYTVLAWDGGTAEPAETTLTVSDGGIGAPVGIIFTVKNISEEVKTYQITKIAPTDEGKFIISAVHSPTDSSGLLLMAKDWDNVGSWVISR
jgi:hypothetical protein